MVLHSVHASSAGFNKVMIRTVDTDVVVLAAANESTIDRAETWIGFGSGKDFNFISVRSIATTLPEKVCEALPLSHALTGCDTVSSFHGKGKKTAWET